MLFQPIDEKKFIGIYAHGAIHRDTLPDGLKATWRPCSFLSDEYTYASLYCGGKSLSEVCPEQLLSRWEQARSRLKAHLLACFTAQVDSRENPLLDSIPEKLLLEVCEVKNQITEHVLLNYPKPENYDFLLSLERTLQEIREHSVNLNLSALQPHLTTVPSRAAYKKLKGSRRVVDYNAFKTKTGRLTTKKGSFPILTLSKPFRRAIEPNNDYFVELDYNAAELRTLLALSGKDQPRGDIHEWNAKNVYPESVTREEAKKRIFAWLYNPESKDYFSNRAYDRSSVVKKYYDGSQVKTFFSRTIPSDDYHALNYIIQSTASDLFLRRAIEISKMLQGKKSYIAFTLHDSLVIDYAEEDGDLIQQLHDTFRDTDLGQFVVNVSTGKNFGEMTKLEL